MQALLMHARGIAGGISAGWNNPGIGGALRSVLLIGVGTLLGYAGQIIIARMIGAAEFGTYCYILGLVTIGRLVVSLSLDVAALRYLGIYFAADDWGRINGFMRTSRGLTLLSAAIGTALAAGAIYVLQDRLQPGMYAALLVGCWLLVPMTWLTLEISALKAFRLVYEPRVPFAVVRPLVIVGFLLAAKFAGLAGTAVLALQANIVGILVTLAISVAYVQTRLRRTSPQAIAPGERKEWGKFCAVNLGQGVLYFALSQQSDIVVVGSLVGTTDAGYYSAASQIAAAMLLAVSAVNQFVAPTLGEYQIKHGDEKLEGIIRRTQWLNILLTLPLVVAVLVLGPLLLQLFGPSFTAAYPVIAILAVGCLINSIWGGLWGDLLTMTGLYRQSSVIVIVAAGLNLVLALILTPKFGIIGTAWATTTAVIVRGILLSVVVKHHFGFWPWTMLRSHGRAS